MFDKIVENLERTKEQKETNTKELVKEVVQEELTVAQEKQFLKEKPHKEKVELLLTQVKNALNLEGKTKTELVSLDQYTEYVLDDEGHNYTYLVVDKQNDGDTLVVEYYGIKYEQQLTQGINFLNVINNSTLKTVTEQILVHVIKTNKKLL